MLIPVNVGKAEINESFSWFFDLFMEKEIDKEAKEQMID